MAIKPAIWGNGEQIKFMKIIVERSLQSCGHSSLKFGVSWRSDKISVAFDICPCCKIMNLEQIISLTNFCYKITVTFFNKCYIKIY